MLKLRETFRPTQTEILFESFGSNSDLSAPQKFIKKITAN